MTSSNQIHPTEELEGVNQVAEKSDVILDKDESEKETRITYENVKETAFKWSKEVSFQGYPKIFDEELHLSLRFIWFVAFLCFTCITSFLIVQSILGYLQWDTISTIQIVREAPTHFPAITLCDSNPFTSKYA